VSAELGGDAASSTFEGELANQELGCLLVAADLHESLGTGKVLVRLLGISLLAALGLGVLLAVGSLLRALLLGGKKLGTNVGQHTGAEELDVEVLHQVV